MPKRDPPSTASTASAPRASSSSSAPPGHRSKRRSPPAPAPANAKCSKPGSDRAGGGDASSGIQPDLASSDPYAILGVPHDATLQQIKLSYRKLALRHHPDRQTSEADREEAHGNFAAIGNAYEILGDEGRRREYDEGVARRGGMGGGGGGRRGRFGRTDPFRDDDFFGRGGGGGAFGRDPFFSMFDRHFFPHPFGGGSGRGSRAGSSRHTEFHFTDPFELFDRFFDEEMSRVDEEVRHHARGGSRRRGPASSRSSASSDPFASDPFFSSSSRGGDPFSSDPFFSSFGAGGGLGGMMSTHFGMANSMMARMSSGGSMFGGFEDQNQLMRGGGGGGSSYNFVSSTSSPSGGGCSVSTSTRTAIVNGVRRTVRERTVVRPDGTVDRHVETLEGDGSGGAGRLPPSDQHALEAGGRRRGRKT